MMTELGAVFLIGLLGSAHCAGMCGGFVMAVTAAAGGPQQRQLHQALYFLGKPATYAVLGALAGAFGQVPYSTACKTSSASRWVFFSW